jgi:hypothetical protein
MPQIFKEQLFTILWLNCLQWLRAAAMSHMIDAVVAYIADAVFSSHDSSRQSKTVSILARRLNIVTCHLFAFRAMLYAFRI